MDKRERDKRLAELFGEMAETVIRAAAQSLGERVGNSLASFPLPLEFSPVLFTPEPPPGEPNKLVVVYSSGSMEAVADIFGRIGDEMREDVAKAEARADSALVKMMKAGDSGL